MTTDDLTLMLSEWILEPFSVVDRGEMELLASPNGTVIQARDAYLTRYQSRLASIRKLCASDLDLIHQHQRTVDILEGLDSAESLTYWDAVTETARFAGVCCRLGMVAFYGPLLLDSPDDLPSPQND